MRTLAILSAIVVLAAPDLAQALDYRGLPSGGGTGVSAVSFADRGGGRGRGGGRERGDDERGRGRDRDRPGDDDRGRGRGGDDARRGVREGRLIPLAEIAARIERRTPGRMLNAFPETGSGGRALYRVRWQADNGERIDFIVDAETGAIIGRD